jgi:hypothetical protein
MMKNAMLFLMLIIVVGLSTIEFQKKVLKKPVNTPSAVTNLLAQPTPLPAGYKSFDGEFVCVPPLQKPSPNAWTQECSAGLKLQDGTYIGISTGDLKDKEHTFIKGANLHVSGMYVPIDQLNHTKPEKYPIKGVITVKTVSKR